LLPSLTEYFEESDGKENKVDVYELRDDFFLFKDKNGDVIIEISIEEFEIDK
jgi:uncharacterized protein YdeI (BOF family)